MSTKALSDKVVIVREDDGTIGLDVDESKVIHQRLGGVGKNNHATIDDHLSSNLNPHSVSAKQVGAVPDSDKGIPKGVAGLDNDALVSECVIPNSIARYSDLAVHKNAVNNPHEVSPVQIGAVSIEAIGSPNGIAFLDGGGRIPHDQLPKDIMRAWSLDDHYSHDNNPHNVTALQTKAVPLYEKGSPGGVVPLGGDGYIDDGLVSVNIARNSELRRHSNDSANPHRLNAMSVGAVSIHSVGSPGGVPKLGKSGFISDEDIAPNIIREDSLFQHVLNVYNPHGVSPDQIGAIPIGTVGVGNGIASLDETGQLKENQIPDYLIGISEFEKHTGLHGNPHKVSAEQVGAVATSCVNKPGGVVLLTPKGVLPNRFLSSAVILEDRFLAHSQAINNPHGVTTKQINAIHIEQLGAPYGPASLDSSGNLEEQQVPIALVRQGQLDSHLENNQNPHYVSAEQVGCDSPMWNAGSLRGFGLPKSAPEKGQILRWDEKAGSFIYDHESMVGEVNESTNVGYGHPLAVGKKDKCLLFRTISSTKSALVSLSTTGEDNHETIWIDINEHNLDHLNIKNSGQRKHVELDSHLDSTGNPHKVTPTQVGNETAQWNANKILGREVSTQRPSDGQVMKWVASSSKWVPSNEAASDAESNDAYNVGVRGVGVFKRKKDAVLEFKKLLSVGNSISLKEDERNSVITISLNEETIIHDKLSGAGSNNHVQIDKHIDSEANPHNVKPNQVGCDKPEWNANKLNGVYVDTSSLQEGDILVYSKGENKFVPVDLVNFVRQVVEGAN